MCTNGLTDVVNNDAAAAVLRQPSSVDEQCKALVDDALAEREGQRDSRARQIQHPCIGDSRPVIGLLDFRLKAKLRRDRRKLVPGQAEATCRRAEATYGQAKLLKGGSDGDTIREADAQNLNVLPNCVCAAKP